MTHTQTEQYLKQDLKNFGLNSQDWNLIPVKGNLYILQNKLNMEFLIAGIAWNFQNWHQLEIIDGLN